jgi:uncharacterized membrane protein HdeD (DUF308 family)
MAITAPMAFDNRELPVWLSVLLGIVFIVAGVIVLGDVVVATIISAFVIGLVAIIGGLFEIIHAFWTKGWGGFVWQILLGALYIGFGVVLVSEPASGALVLTWVFGLILLASGVIRLVVGVRGWSNSGWLLALSGIFGILAGFAILAGWPATGLWVIGFLLGIDLIFHGFGWLIFAWQPVRELPPKPL